MSEYNEELDTKIKEFNSFDLNTDNSLDIKSIIDFIINNYKQILLLLLAFVIIYVVDHITYYNSLFYSMPSAIPGASQPQQTKSNTFKKKSGKNKK
jgi:hypothetical protein